MTEKHPSAVNHALNQLASPDGTSWIGLVDGIYAIAMTLIAIDLPQLLATLLALPKNGESYQLITRLVAYEFIAYIATFLVLYELWSVHRCILKIGGLKCQIQNVLNGIVLALSCLGAGNIILILHEKTTTAAEAIRNNTKASSLLSTWVNSHAPLVLVTFAMIAAMYMCMASMARTSDEYQSSSTLRALARSLWSKCLFFCGSLVIWAPLLFKQKIFIPPALVVIIFLLISYNQHHLTNFIKHRNNHA